jgi:hypothetical protein
MTTKTALIAASAGIAAAVIVACVVVGVHAVGEGLRFAGFLGIAGAIRAICGSGGLDGRSGRREGWFADSGD